MIISNHNISCRQLVIQKVVYREGINSPTNVDLVTTILITTHICEQHANAIQTKEEKSGQGRAMLEVKFYYNI